MDDRRSLTMTSDDSTRARLAAMGAISVIAKCAVLLVSLASAAGCVMGNDSDPPVLSADLYWETERYSDRKCATAKVAAIQFRLLDADGELIVESEPDDAYQGAARCVNGIDFPDLSLGDYVLELTGYDADHNVAWRSQCDLSLDRFDRLYDCTIEKVTDTDDAAPSS
jgi:hypothetical protein